MKTRDSLVSNSSSTSFIVPQKFTTAQLASVIVEFIDNEVKERWGGGYPQTDPALKLIEEEIALGADDPILIPWTTNYETWIRREKEGIVVRTSNNHRWKEMLPDLIYRHYEDEEISSFECDNTFYLDISSGNLVTRAEYYDSLYRRYLEEDTERQCS